MWTTRLFREDAVGKVYLHVPSGSTQPAVGMNTALEAFQMMAESEHDGRVQRRFDPNPTLNDDINPW